MTPHLRDESPLRCCTVGPPDPTSEVESGTCDLCSHSNASVARRRDLHSVLSCSGAATVTKPKAKAVDQRNAQLVRLLSVLRDLDRLGGVDLYELAERHATTVRTIRRDLSALEEAGIPLVEEPEGKRKRWRVAYRAHLRQLSTLIDAGHYLALRVAMGQGGAVRGASALFAQLEDLADKLEDVLGSQGRAQLEAISEAFHSNEKRAYQRATPEVVWPLVSAIAERRLCKVTYEAASSERRAKVFEVLPLLMFPHHGALYLSCYVPKHDSVIILNLHRLRELKVLTRTAEPPETVDPRALADAAFGVIGNGPATTYRLLFHAEHVPFVSERVWHPSQMLEPLPHGGAALTFTCPASPEVSAWVASWRLGAIVEAPDALRRELLEYGVWLATTYAAPAGG